MPFTKGHLNRGGAIPARSANLFGRARAIHESEQRLKEWIVKDKKTFRATPQAGERLIHYSAKPLLAVQSAKQGPPTDKPNGLWVPVEGTDDWKAWCESESFSLDRMACAHELFLITEASVLRICTARQLDAFTSRYRYREEPMFRRHRLQPSIDWSQVAARYEGIIIAPYLWERRLDDRTFWYYSWDCASGCIWNAGAVRNIVALPVCTNDEAQTADA